MPNVATPNFTIHCLHLESTCRDLHLIHIISKGIFFDSPLRYADARCALQESARCLSEEDAAGITDGLFFLEARVRT